MSSNGPCRYLIDEQSATVKHLLPRLKSKLRWNYDFGDGWEHEVAVDGIESPQKGKHYPLCIDVVEHDPTEHKVEAVVVEWQ